MSAVLRLTLTCFTATPLTRRLAEIGITAIIVGLAGTVWLGGYPQIFYMGREPALYEMLIVSLPFMGLILLVASTVLLPAIVERMALGRAVWVLPGGRSRLLVSTVLPAVLLSLLVAVGTSLSFLISPFDVPLSMLLQSFYRIFLMAFVDFGLIYTAIWLVGKTSGVWRLAGTLWIVVSITIPLRYTGGGIPPFSFLEGLGLASWVVYATLLLSGGRLRHSLPTLRARLTALGERIFPVFRYSAGHEVDLLLGTTRPWIVALGQAIPIGLMVWFVPFAPIWIMFLVTFSAIAGATTSQAAAHSRRLWLRYDWTREDIRRRVEAAYWRYNAWALSVLLVIYMGLASYAGFDWEVVALSIVLIMLGGIACTYLGLMITRGLGWFEATLGILSMIVLVLAAFAILRGMFVAAVELEVVLAGLGVAYALIARRRWGALDWMQCRLDTPVRGAA